MKECIKRICIAQGIKYDDSLSEEFLDMFERKVHWYSASRCNYLTENFIRRFHNSVKWHLVCNSTTLSEELISDLAKSIDWYTLLVYQEIPEHIIRKFHNQVYWGSISKYQKLSEKFIDEFSHLVHWVNISEYQTLSEDFIRKHKDDVNWDFISAKQILSEDFIREFQDYVIWDYIGAYQKLSKKFRDEFNIKVRKNCWLYKTNKSKLKFLREHTDYEIVDDKYVIAYKAVKNDYRSVTLPNHYKYEVGKTYTSNCDCNVDEESSFGLSAWSASRALDFHSQGRLLKVKIDIKDIGAIIRHDNKIRCRKQEILFEEDILMHELMQAEFNLAY